MPETQNIAPAPNQPEPEAPNHTPVEHAYSTPPALGPLQVWLHTAGQAGRRVVSELGKVDNRICIVLEWTPEEASLLQDRQSAAASVYISRDSEPPEILYETCACIIHY